MMGEEIGIWLFKVGGVAYRKFVEDFDMKEGIKLFGRGFSIFKQKLK